VLQAPDPAPTRIVPYRRSRIGPTFGLAVVLAAAVTTLLVTVRNQDRPDDGTPAVRPWATPTAAQVTPASTVQAAPASIAAGSSRPPAVTPLVLRYDFNGYPVEVASGGSARLPLAARTAEGGTLRTERHGDGLAVRFPAKCSTRAQEDCPRAILESNPSESLNPGRRPLRYGAAVRLSPTETAKGENVLQKGYSAGTSQFKLQIDGTAGRPSCVVVGIGSPEVYAVTAAGSVADGQWHAVECARSGTLLSIRVDGRDAGQGTVPAGLSIVNYLPLRIGGKGAGPNNDQFHGAIDDVSVLIDAG